MLLEDKVAIVTGAAQGIGKATAERLAREGAKVVVVDINEKAGAKVVEGIKSTGKEAIFLACDVSERLDVHNLIAATLGSFDRIDVLVNNAAVIDTAPFLKLEERELDRVLGVNLKGSFLVGQAVARQMVEQAKGSSRAAGSIVNISSVNAEFALADHVAYSISKGGISQLTKAMALALAPYHIRVNAVGPGTIETPILENVVKDRAKREMVLSRTPLGRFGRPEEIAAVVVWLASEEASYLTGETIFADGGRRPLNYVVSSAVDNEDEDG